MKRLLIVAIGLLILVSSSAYAHKGEHKHPADKEDTLLPIAFSLKLSWWLPTETNADLIYGGFGNEVYSFRFAVPIYTLMGAIEPFFEPGLLFEKARLRGVNSNRESSDTSKLRLIPIRAGATYVFMPRNWVVVPAIEAAYSAVFFDLEEDNVSVDGTKHLLSFRGGFRVLIDRTVNESDWRDFMGVRSAFFAVMGGYDVNLSGSGLNLEGFVFGPEVGIIF